MSIAGPFNFSTKPLRIITFQGVPSMSTLTVMHENQSQMSQTSNHLTISLPYILGNIQRFAIPFFLDERRLSGCGI
jgi:hypothetical protein